MTNQPDDDPEANWRGFKAQALTVIVIIVATLFVFGPLISNVLDL